MTQARERPSRKNLRQLKPKIDRARRIPSTPTETETVERALDLVMFGERLMQGVDRMRGGRLVDVYARAD